MGDGKVRDDGDECGDGDNENNNHTNSIISFQLLTYLNNFLLFNY